MIIHLVHRRGNFIFLPIFEILPSSIHKMGNKEQVTISFVFGIVLYLHWADILPNLESSTTCIQWKIIKTNIFPWTIKYIGIMSHSNGIISFYLSTLEDWRQNWLFPRKSTIELGQKSDFLKNSIFKRIKLCNFILEKQLSTFGYTYIFYS